MAQCHLLGMSPQKAQDNSLIPLGPAFDSEAVAMMRKKQALALLLAAGRIGVRARTGWSELRLLRQAEAAWHETRAPGVHLQRRTCGCRECHPVPLAGLSSKQT